jgi:hypothetical protein
MGSTPVAAPLPATAAGSRRRPFAFLAHRRAAKMEKR